MPGTPPEQKQKKTTMAMAKEDKAAKSNKSARSASCPCPARTSAPVSPVAGAGQKTIVNKPVSCASSQCSKSSSGSYQAPPLSSNATKTLTTATTSAKQSEMSSAMSQQQQMTQQQQTVPILIGGGIPESNHPTILGTGVPKHNASSGFAQHMAASSDQGSKKDASGSGSSKMIQSVDGEEDATLLFNMSELRRSMPSPYSVPLNARKPIDKSYMGDLQPPPPPRKFEDEELEEKEKVTTSSNRQQQDDNESGYFIPNINAATFVPNFEHLERGPPPSLQSTQAHNILNLCSPVSSGVLPPSPGELIRKLRQQQQGQQQQGQQVVGQATKPPLPNPFWYLFTDEAEEIQWSDHFLAPYFAKILDEYMSRDGYLGGVRWEFLIRDRDRRRRGEPKPQCDHKGRPIVPQPTNHSQTKFCRLGLVPGVVQADKGGTADFDDRTDGQGSR